MPLTGDPGFRVGLVLLLIAVSLVHTPRAGLGEPTELARLAGRNPESGSCGESLVSPHRTPGILTKILQDLEILKTHLGETHPLYAVWLLDVAAEFHRAGDLAEAEQCYLQTLNILQDGLGATRFLHATTMDKLANVYDSGDDGSRAFDSRRQAGEIFKHALPEKGGDTPRDILGEPQYFLLQYFRNKSWHLLESGDILESIDPGFSGRLIKEIQKHLKLTSEGLSERQQMAMAEMFRPLLDRYLSRALLGVDNTHAAVESVLNWKGAIFSRQRQYRQIQSRSIGALLVDRLRLIPSKVEQANRRIRAYWTRTNSDLLTIEIDQRRRKNGQQIELDQILEEVIKQLVADLSVEKKDDALRAWVELIAISAERDLLEGELSRQSVASLQPPPWVTVADVASALPDGSVLVDFLVIVKSTPQQEEDRGHRLSIVASVVRPDGTAKLFDLGSAQPVDEQLLAWFKCIVYAEQQMDHQCVLHGQELRKTLWEPLMSALGTPKMVFISPDGFLGVLPWAALPGAAKSTYLIQEYEIVVQPFSQQLPILAKSGRRQDCGERLLVVGNVDFNASTIGPVNRDKPDNSWVEDMGHSRGEGGEGGQNWPLLDTSAENNAVTESFRQRPCQRKDQVTVPTEQNDTKNTACEDFGPDRIAELAQQGATKQCFGEVAPEANTVHVATHGFLVTGDVEGRLNDLGFHPQRFSGLVMAGANNRYGRRLQDDDGILTAMEVSFLPLGGVDLVNLAACVTGLGTFTKGEGMLDLRRAFLMAGARSTVTSLWNIDNSPTTEFNKLFYQYLWKGKMTRSAALREAQLSLIENPRYSLPKYWALFQISGDWR